MMHSYESLGQIMIKAYGLRWCADHYHAADAATVGRLALEHGDINRGGNLNR